MCNTAARMVLDCALQSANVGEKCRFDSACWRKYCCACVCLCMCGCVTNQQLTCEANELH